MADFDWMLGVIMLSGFLFAAIARFNLHRYVQYKRVPADFDNQQYLEALESSSPKTILDDGLHQLFKYVMAGIIIFLVASTTLVSIIFD
ncbi:MAG: hypothetical protein ACI935_002237 [Moritella dasanensis]|jgi:hypothetical protein